MDISQEYTIFNSINPDHFEPNAKKALPYPLENFDEQLADAYNLVDRLFIQLKATKINPVNQTKAKQKRILSLIYKVNTCKKILKEVSKQTQELWF